MFAVFAAEQQYHHDTRVRERERVILASIRERSAVVPLPVRTVVTARPQRAAWPRPIGVRTHEELAADCALA